MPFSPGKEVHTDKFYDMPQNIHKIPLLRVDTKMLKIFFQDKITEFDPFRLPLEKVVRKSSHQQAVSSQPSVPSFNALDEIFVRQTCQEMLRSNAHKENKKKGEEVSKGETKTEK